MLTSKSVLLVVEVISKDKCFIYVWNSCSFIFGYDLFLTIIIPNGEVLEILVIKNYIQLQSRKIDFASKLFCNVAVCKKVS